MKVGEVAKKLGVHHLKVVGARKYLNIDKTDLDESDCNRIREYLNAFDMHETKVENGRTGTVDAEVQILGNHGLFRALLRTTPRVGVIAFSPVRDIRVGRRISLEWKEVNRRVYFRDANMKDLQWERRYMTHSIDNEKVMGVLMSDD